MISIKWMTMQYATNLPLLLCLLADHDSNKRAIWMKQQVPLDLDFLIWLQCEWFTCSDKVTKELVTF